MKELSLFNTLPEAPQKPCGPVTCLGMTFENDEARRAYFTEELRKKLLNWIRTAENASPEIVDA